MPHDTPLIATIVAGIVLAFIFGALANRHIHMWTAGVARSIDLARHPEGAISAEQAISAAEKAAFLANPEIVPLAADLTLTHIMSQKYIAQWAWGHLELWMDMRRFHYTDLDPASGTAVAGLHSGAIVRHAGARRTRSGRDRLGTIPVARGGRPGGLRAE